MKPVKITVRAISIEKFIKMEGFLEQRATEAHAKAAQGKNGHLREPHISQAVVSSVQVKGSPEMKVDGHTRSLLWATGKLGYPPTEKPGSLILITYHFDTLDGAKSLYRTFDERKASKTQKEQVAAATRGLDVEFESELLASSKEKSGYNWIYPMNALAFRTFAKAGSSGWTAEDAHIAAEHYLKTTWRDVFVMVDTLPAKKSIPYKRSGQSNRIGTSVALMAAVFVSVAYYKDTPDEAKVLDFWAKFFLGEGVKMGTQQDAVEWAADACRRIHGSGTQPLLFNHLIVCVQRWLRGTLCVKAPALLDADTLQAWQDEAWANLGSPDVYVKKETRT